VTAAAPAPASSSQPIIRSLASVIARPSSVTSSLLDAMPTPSPVKASGHSDAGASGERSRASNHESGGRTTPTTGSSNSLANSKSRWSWAGTAMIAPVP